MNLYTIGFTQKSAQTFFSLLADHGVKRLVDIRVNPSGQLAGFARKEDLPYFLKELAGGCEYVYLPELAPTREMMHSFREVGDWDHYVSQFEALMDERHIPAVLDRALFEEGPACLLCSEAKPDHCHRRLVAERLTHAWKGLAIVHL